MAVYRTRFVRPADPRLGRHVNHDERSRAYAYRAPRRAVLHSVRHERHVPVFDQGNIGSCTGNAAIGCLATGPFWSTMSAEDTSWWPLDEDAAVRCYSQATASDPYAGQYPPTDTGSDGLSVAKVLTATGAISGYRHAFTLGDTLAALMEFPLIVGTVWTDDMFSPATNGLVTPTGSDAGGHEYLLDEYDHDERVVGFTNSWGDGWGVAGRFRMRVPDFGDLLSRDGDATVFVPTTQPAPVPEPSVVDTGARADLELARQTKVWAERDGISGRRARRALRAWFAAKGM